MQKIVPHLWFDKEAIEAADFYTSFFDDARINYTSTIKDTPSGDSELVSFSILGYDFMAISAGPLFKINPSISFHVRCSSFEEVDAVWERLTDGGIALMELGEYPFSKRFGWVQDKYGVSWQIIFTEAESEQRIIPAFLFTQDGAGKAEEAINFYATVFPDSLAQVLDRYAAGEEPDTEGTVRMAYLKLAGQEFVALDSAHAHAFKFNEAVSLIVNCEDQAEIDYFWDRLSAVPEAEQCGWVKDKFGVSWQIIPENLPELMDKNPDKTTPVLLKMHKIIIDDLVKAGAD